VVVVINRSTRVRGVYTGEEAAALDEEERNRHAGSTLLRYNQQQTIHAACDNREEELVPIHIADICRTSITHVTLQVIV
jgi:hypothetical protein